MEKLDEIVKRNLQGSAYLRTWLDLPHHLKCVIAESANEAYKISFNPVLADSKYCRENGHVWIEKQAGGYFCLECNARR